MPEGDDPIDEEDEDAIRAKLDPEFYDDFQHDEEEEDEEFQ